MSLQMWIDILATYCYSLAGDDFNWVHVTNKLLCSAATGWNFTVTVVCCRTAVLLLCFIIFEIQTSGILTQLSRWCCWVQFYVDYLLIKFLAFFSWAFSELLQILEDRSTTQWFHNHALCLCHSCLFLLQKFPKLLLLSFFDGAEVSLSGLDLDL